jgi:hypothetical protein
VITTSAVSIGGGEYKDETDARKDEIDARKDEIDARKDEIDARRSQDTTTSQ